MSIYAKRLFGGETGFVVAANFESVYANDRGF